MPLPLVLARTSRRLLNPVALRWAGHVPGYCVLEHVGRRSGRHHRTPLVVFQRGDGVAFLVSYWPQCDWARNVLAAGGATVVRRGRRSTLARPRVLTGAAGSALLPRPVRVFARLARAEAVLTAAVIP